MLQLSAASLDAPQTGWLHLAWVPLVLALLWMAASLALTSERRWRRDGVRFGLIASGILIVGWLTYTCGPGIGLLFLLLGGLPAVFRRNSGKAGARHDRGGRRSQPVLLTRTSKIDARGRQP